MATTSYGVRKLKTSVAKSSARSDFPFGVNRGLVSAQNRDVAEFEDFRHRSFIERMKDAFRTISFRSEPTIGEEDLKRCYNAQTPVNGQVNHSLGYPMAEKKHEELIQNLVPDCYEHIQNFHHYRSDMERLNSGCKVLYLSANDRIGKGDDILRRVYGQNSAKTDQYGPQTRRYGFVKPRHFQMPRKLKSTMVTKVPKNSSTPLLKGKAKTIKNPNKNVRSSWNQTLDRSETLSSGKNSKSCSGNSTEFISLNNVDKHLSFQEDPSVSASDEIPSFTLEQSTNDDRAADIQRSSHSLGSDLSPKPPMTTPNDMSRRSSVRTILFENQEELVQTDKNPKSPRNTANNLSPHYLAPFHSRFPHLKSSESTSSFQMRQKRSDNGSVPSWQQYRILCDAFRPALSPEKFQRQNAYRKPKYATASELEYYIDIVSETNSNSSMYTS
ncbi:uncharacterized protein LOC144641154 [Oculina patagonica]